MTKRILAIDDDQSILTIIKKIIEKHEVEVVTETNPVKGLELAFKESFDLFILDVSMPGMDGLDLCRSIKEDERTKDIPVVFLSAKSEMGDMLSGYFQGAHTYLTKPFDANLLSQKVLSLMK